MRTHPRAVALALVCAALTPTRPARDPLRDELLARYAEVVEQVGRLREGDAGLPALVAATAVIDMLMVDPASRLGRAPADTVEHLVPRGKATRGPDSIYVDHVTLPSGTYVFRISRSEAPAVFELLDQLNP